ncbi:TniQ family protein (plasmid) [Ensifer adhaerens]|uniref:TniQ family protein n=1 Tax=Ensifer adhaerens TaxID=106592 RepID=UPI0023A93F88|nr:TniQ family protein [Ensifer adhaerens]WDZ81362.1 TniQ family protein [Ensifer adhaerens]
MPLHSDETIASYCSRTAAVNGLPKAAVFASHLGFSFRGLANGNRADVDTFADAVGLSYDELRHALMVTDGTRLWIGGECVPRTQLQRQRLRFCPHCVVEDETIGTGRRGTRAYARVNWSVSAIRTCLLHRTKLVTSEKTSRSAVYDFTARLNWERPTMQAHVEDAEAQEPSRLEHYVAGRLVGAASAGALLDVMPLYAAIKTTEWVGAAALFGTKISFEEVTDAQWHQAGKAGFDIMCEGESSVRSFFASLCSDYFSNRVSMHPAAVFGKLYRLLKSRESDPGFECVRQICREVAVTQLPYGPGDEVFAPVLERNWHTVGTAAKAHGLAVPEVRTLFRAGGLLPSIPGERQKRTLVEAHIADKLLEDARNALSFGQARELLGMNIEDFRAMIDLGCLKPLLTIRDGGHMIPYFARTELGRFQSDLRDRVTMESFSPGMTSIGDAARRARCTVKDVIKLLFDRKLQKVGLNERAPGFAGLLVDAAEVLERTRTSILNVFDPIE